MQGVVGVVIETRSPPAEGDQSGAPTPPCCNDREAWKRCNRVRGRTYDQRGDVGWAEMRWSWRGRETKLLADVLTATEGGVCGGARRMREGGSHRVRATQAT